MACKYKIGNQEFETKEALKTYISQRRNISDNMLNAVGIKPVVSLSPHQYNTDQWAGMAMRRVMQMAAQEGFDRVAWVTGEQSADRYDLSEQVEKIGWNNTIRDNALVSINLRGKVLKYDVNRESGLIEDTVLGENHTGKNLEDLVGKEIAQRVLQEKEGDLSGEGLKVGGEGMKTFYNQIVPKVALKEAQRFDKKAKIDTVNIVQTEPNSLGAAELYQMGLYDSVEEAELYVERHSHEGKVSKQLSIKLTPKTKAILTGAVPLFSKNNLPKGTLPNKVRGNNVMEVGDTKVYFKNRENPITGEVLPGIELDLIETAPEARGKGSAKKAMAQFLEYADRTKQKVYVVISPRDNSTTEEGIKAFNRQFGFKDDSDFEMSRNPQKIKSIDLKELSKQLGKNQLAEKVHILSPKQIEQELISRGIDANIAKQVSAWHGSPHLFDRFSTEYMGSGEGAQAFGWGLYFTDLENIARGYAKALAITTFKGEKIDDVAFFEKLLSGLDDTNESFYDLDKGTITDLNKFRQYIKDSIDSLEQSIPNINVENQKYQNLADRYTYQNTDLSDLKSDIDIYEHFKKVANDSSDKNDMVNKALPSFKAKADAARKMILEVNKGKKNRNEILKSIVDYDLRRTKSSLNYYKYIDNNFDKFNISRNLYKVSLHKGKTPITSAEYRVAGRMVINRDVSKAKGEYGSKEPLMRFDTHEEAVAWLEAEDAKAEYTWLEWDKPVNSKLLSKIKNDFKKQRDNFKRTESYSQSDKYLREYYDDLLKKIEAVKMSNNSDLYKRLSVLFGSDKGASLFLLENGIDGIKYPAESISRGATSDNARGFNYVVFDENAITIEETIQFQKEGIGMLPNGFVDLKTGEVFLNQETANLDTPIHEFSHLFNNLLKQTNPELYRRGLELIEKEGQEYIDFVKANQPELEGEALLEEALAQAVGESGAKLVNKQSALFQWIQDMWNSLKDMLGLTQYSWEEVKNMNLDQFSEAMAIDLLKGNTLTSESITDEIDNFNTVRMSRGSKNRADSKISVSTPYLKGEIARLSKVEEVNEDGATLNLDGTKYTGGGLVVPITSINSTQSRINTKVVEDFIEKNRDKIGSDIVKFGLYKFPEQVTVSVDLNIVIPAEYKKIALEFGKLAGQESLYNLDTGEYEPTGADGVNPREFSAEEFSEIASSLAKGQLPNTVQEKEVAEGNKKFNRPLPEAETIAREYMESIGESYEDFQRIEKNDIPLARAMSNTFEELKHSPDSETIEAYEDMAEQTIAQYEAIVKHGYEIEVNNTEPYSSSGEMIEDLRQNKNMKIFSTESGFGDTPITEEQRAEDPRLRRTEYTDKNGVPLLVNDVFRFVHDFFGHAVLGNGFGPIGEENAWQMHVRMFTGEAKKAMTTETRGQNSWVNFSGVNDKPFAKRDRARALRKEGNIEEADRLTGEVYNEMQFAEQKLALSPDWMVRPDAKVEFLNEAWDKLTPIQQAESLGYKVDPKGSKVSDGEGNFKYGRRTYVPIDDVVDRDIMTPSEIKLLDFWGNTPIRMYGGRTQSEGIAMYNRSDKSISINVNNKLGGIVLTSQKKVNETVVHEIIHHLVNTNVQNKEGFDIEIGRIRDIISENKHLATPYVQNIIGHMESGSPEEVVTYALSDKQVAEFLNSIESRGTGTGTVWARFVKAIVDILRGNSLLGDVVAVLDKYTDTLDSNVDYSSGFGTYNMSIEPELSIKNADSYRDALNKEQDIEIGVETRDGFKTLITIPYNVNPETAEGFVNKYIKEGFLKEERTIKNGKQYYTVEGINYLDRKNKELLLEEDLVAMLGAERSEIKDGLIDIKDKIKAVQTLDKGVIKDMVTELFKTHNVGIKRNTAPKRINEQELKLKLMTLLNKMGVETMSISEYVEKYNKKNGVDPSVRALADAVNRVVAFKDGIITLKDLTEEVMHIIVETLPQAEIEGILRNIHHTSEYSQFAQQYRETYSKAYPKLNSEQLENLVRKEILGKVLKNSTLANLEQTTQRNFYERALDYIKGFFDRISGKQDIQEQLKAINNRIEDLFVQENLSDYLDNNLGSDVFPMYSIGDQASGDRTLDLARSIQKSIINSLRQSYSTITKSYGALYADKVRVQKLGDMIDTVSQASAASDFLGLVKRQVDFVQRAVDNSKRDNVALSLEARQVLVNLNDSLRTLLEKQRDVTKKLTPEQLGLKGERTSEAEAEISKKALVDKITEVLSQVSQVSGEASNVFDSTFDDIIERIALRHDLSPAKIEHLRSQSEMMNNEIGFFMETFGQLIHSSDALLNIAANVVEEMWGKHAAMTQSRMRKFTKVMDENGITPEQLTELFDRGFLISEYDFPKFQERLKATDLKIYNEIFKENISQEEYDQLKEKRELKQFDDNQNNTAQRMKSEALSDLVERRMNNEYYEEQAKKYEALGISKYTIDQMKALSLQRAIVQEAATDDSGKVIYTENNKDELDALSQTRKEYKSIVDSFGSLKQGYIEMSKAEARAAGIDLTNTESNRFLEVGELIYLLAPDATNEAKLSFELHLIDKDFENTGRQRNIQEFIDKFVEITNDQGIQRGVEFLENNVGISFSSEFWDSVSTENLLDNVDVNLVPGNAEIIKRIRQKRNRLSQLKKLYQDPMNPQEVKGNEMSSSEQEIIKSLVEDIDVEMRSLQIPEGVERQTSFDSEVSVNQAYKDAISKEVKQELGKEEFKFIRKHVTSQNENYLIGMENDAKALDRGAFFGSEKVKTRLESYMEEGDTSYYQAFVRMARTRVLPYYKRYTPEGYQTLRELNSEETSDHEKQSRLIDYIFKIDADPNYELNIHYSFDAASKDINPNWDNNFEGGFNQPKLSEFLNEKFVKMFDPEIVNGKFTGVVRKNQKLYNVQQALLELQRENLESIGQRGTANIYKAPQISRTRSNQIVDFFKKKNKGLTFKEMVKDTFSYRVDDLEYGNSENNAQFQRSSETRTIPVFYTRDLENQEDVTDDLFYSYIAMTNQAVLHQVRREGITDIRAVEDKMLNRSNPQGKSAQATRNYKMLKSYIDYNYYGVKESTSYKVKLPIINKEVDLTKILRQLNNYVKLRNLGLNFIVPFTSYITAEVNSQIEASLGEYFSRDSLRVASREYGKLVREAGFVKNSLSYNDNSKINVLGEWLGVYSMSEKAANAKYSTLMRWLPKVGMVLHQAGNFPIIPRVFLSIMFDNRVVGGKLISRRQFLDSHTDKKKAKSEWSTYQNKSLYHYLNITEGGVEIKPELLQELGGDQAYLDAKMQAIRSLVKDQVEKIDGMIPESQRVEAQRNAVYNYLMTHRGWLAIGAQKRLKGLQLNLETGQMEEGTYVTMKNLLFDFFGELGGGESKTWNFVKAMKEAYKGTRGKRDAELIRRNMKRMGVEFAFLTGIVFILAAVTAMADDEENKDLYALQLTNYFMWRLANETSSTQLGLFTELADVVRSPIVGYQQVENMGNLAMIFDGEYQGGTYRGHSGLYKYLHTNTVGLKSLHDLKNIKRTRETYIHFNRDNIDFSSMFIFNLLHD